MRIIITATNLLIDTTEDSYVAMFENQPIATACKGATRYEARQALLGKQPTPAVDQRPLLNQKGKIMQTQTLDDKLAVLAESNIHVYESPVAFGFYGYSGCDADIYETAEAAADAALSE